MSPGEIKAWAYGAAALLAWVLTPRAGNTAAPRVTQTLVIDSNVDSPYFGMDEQQIAAAKAKQLNPAVDPEMRRLIDESNAAIAADTTTDGLE